MGKAGQVCGAIEDLDPDQAATLGKLHLVGGAQWNTGKWLSALEVSERISKARSSAPTVKAKLAPKALAERSRPPRLTDLEMPSAPIPK
ncbi:hypothetical protein [Methyloceanibacter methanicus]|uniref:hypothetical protein n=1 Tax=Methyloceanibacter methanicus TaxID=1774968 RepID=UPI001FCCD4FE|nr:hypothetical protein [Methyloceanibacter methanicus]